MKYCRYCNEPMEEREVTGATNPYTDGRPIPAYICINPACKMRPHLFRYDTIKPCDEKYSSGYTVNVQGHGKVYREWYCPFCDNPVEVLDSVYFTWNCPNCKHLASGGITFRYYPIKINGDTETFDTDEEITELRHCGTRWDPFAKDDEVTYDDGAEEDD